MGKVTEAEKGYLGGLIDGEGTVVAYSRRDGFHVSVSIASTSSVIASEAYRIARGLGIPMRLFGPYDRGKRKPMYRVTVQDKMGVATLAKEMLGYVKEKAPQLVVLLRYIESHEFGTKRDRVAEDECERTLRSMKKLPCGENLSETTPSQASDGQEALWPFVSEEGVTVRRVSANDNPAQERPAPKIWNGYTSPDSGGDMT